MFDILTNVKRIFSKLLGGFCNNFRKQQGWEFSAEAKA